MPLSISKGKPYSFAEFLARPEAQWPRKGSLVRVGLHDKIRDIVVSHFVAFSTVFIGFTSERKIITRAIWGLDPLADRAIFQQNPEQFEGTCQILDENEYAQWTLPEHQTCYTVALIADDYLAELRQQSQMIREALPFLMPIITIVDEYIS